MKSFVSQIPTIFINICIIDFSRAIDKKNKYVCAEKLFNMVLDIYPEYSDDKVFKEKLYNITLLKTDILFDIMSGYDIYYLLTYLYSLFTDKQFLKLKFFPTHPVAQLKFIYNMFIYTKNIMLKNINKLMTNTLKDSIVNTNEILLYKFYDKFLLKNNSKEDFYVDKKLKHDTPGYFQFLESEEWLDIINNKKLYITNIYNLQNELKITNLQQLMDTYTDIQDNNNTNEEFGKKLKIFKYIQ